MEGSTAVGLDELIADVLAGRRRSIARAMSLAESTGPVGRTLALKAGVAQRTHLLLQRREHPRQLRLPRLEAQRP